MEALIIQDNGPLMVLKKVVVLLPRYVLIPSAFKTMLSSNYTTLFLSFFHFSLSFFLFLLKEGMRHYALSRNLDQVVNFECTKKPLVVQVL